MSGLGNTCTWKRRDEINILKAKTYSTCIYFLQDTNFVLEDEAGLSGAEKPSYKSNSRGRGDGAVG